MRLLVAALAAATCLGFFGSTSALGPNLDIIEVQCDPPPHPPGGFDLIKITNVGDAPQDLTGWRLRSDPEETEEMSLAVAGTLDPGEQPLLIVAGPHSAQIPDYNMYIWSPTGVLREGEPMDYVKLIDPNGNMVEGLQCNGQPLATPTPEPTAAPPTPTPPPAVAAVTEDTSSSTSTDTQNTGQTSGSTGQTSQQQVAGSVLAPAPDTGLGSLAPAGTSATGFLAWAALALGATGVIAGAALVKRGALPGMLSRRSIRPEGDNSPRTVEPRDSHSKG